MCFQGSGNHSSKLTKPKGLCEPSFRAGQLEAQGL